MGLCTYLLLKRLIRKVDKIMATQAELAAKLNTISDELVKVGAETSKLIAMVADLQTQVANAPVSAELSAAVDKVAAQAKLVDDLVPDAP